MAAYRAAGSLAGKRASGGIPLHRHEALACLDVRNLAVAHVQDAIGDRSSLRVVRDHQHSLVELAAGGAQHGKNGVRVLGVEVAGGLIGQDDGGSGDEGASDGDALLFAAGEFVWAMIQTAADTEEIGEVREERTVEWNFAAGDLVRDFDVAHGGEGWKEVKALKDKAYFGFAQARAGAVREWGEIDAVDGDGAGGGLGEAAEDVEEGGFARTGGADDGDELAGGDLEADAPEGRNLNLSSAIRLAESFGDDDGVHGLRCEFTSPDGMIRDG